MICGHDLTPEFETKVRAIQSKPGESRSRWEIILSVVGSDPRIPAGEHYSMSQRIAWNMDNPVPPETRSWWT